MKHNIIKLNKTSTIFRVLYWKRIKEWLIFVSKKEDVKIENIYITLVSDEELLDINKKSLKHNYLTDILTFNLSDTKKNIYGDIYVSYDRTKENSLKFKVTHNEELRRVFIHGLLHLIGYDDKTSHEKENMRKKENYYLNIYNRKFHVEHII